MDKREAAAALRKGTRAEDLQEFMDEWLKLEKERAVDELLNSSRDPSFIRADLQADIRIAGRIKALINESRRAGRILDGN